MTEQTLTYEEVAERLTELEKGWTRDTKHIVRNYEFASFADGIAFVGRLGAVADKLNHHPDIDIRWTTVHLEIATHSAGGVTPIDFDLASHADEIAANFKRS